MGKCKCTIRENNAVGKHSVYASYVPSGTLSFDDAIKFACKGTDIEQSAMRRDIVEFMRTVQDFALMGYRVALGDKFLTVYPVVSASVKDYVDPKTGEPVVATADMVNLRSAKSRLGCSVSSAFSKKFDAEVSWVRVDDKGQELPDEEDITEEPEGGDQTPTGGDGNDGEGQGSGSGDNGSGDDGNGDLEG